MNAACPLSIDQGFREVRSPARAGCAKSLVCCTLAVGLPGRRFGESNNGNQPKRPTPPPPHQMPLQTAGPPGRQSFLQTSNYNSILGRETGSDEAISIAIFCCIFFFRSLFFAKRRALLLIIPLFAPRPPHRIVHRVSPSSALLPSAKFAKENTRSRSRSRPRPLSRSRTMNLYASSTDRSLKFLV